MTSSPSAADSAPGDLELPRPPGTIRRFLTGHPRLVDAAVAAVYLVPALGVGLANAITAPAPPAIATVSASAVAGFALLARRRHPGVVLVIALIPLVVTILVGSLIDLVPTTFALYALAAYRSARQAWIGYAAAAAAGLTSMVIHVLRTDTSDVFVRTATIGTFSVLILSVFLAPTLIGINIGNRRRYLDALIDRAHQLARERDQQAEIATASERSRIAREMHDIVSHSLTVMITLADGSARLAESAPARSAEAMRMVAETGRDALADMRRLLGVLRADEDEAAAHEPQPGIAELDGLIERFQAAGLPVRIAVDGRPPENVGQQLTVFRVVQEALTNAVRYAPLSTDVSVAIRFGADRISILVEDDATVTGDPGQGSGRGLVGLRERVALYGGTLEAGPRLGGGWRLSASFDTVPTHGALPQTATDQEEDL